MTEPHMIEIAKGGKYMLILPESMSLTHLEIIRKRIDEWLASDDPILVAYGITLTRVDDSGEHDADL